MWSVSTHTWKITSFQDVAKYIPSIKASPTMVFPSVVIWSTFNHCCTVWQYAMSHHWCQLSHVSGVYIFVRLNERFYGPKVASEVTSKHPI